MEPTSQRLIEDQAQEQLRRIFDDVDTWVRRWGEGALTAPVAPGSSLAGDDARSAPYHVSHGVTHMITVAVDHLHALKVLIQDARKLHNSAPYTLARSSIEASATAIWLLAPPARATRVLRRLSHAAQDSRDGTLMATEARAPVQRQLSEILDDIRPIASGVAGPGAALKRLNVTEMIREADKLGYTPLNALAAWRTCSGFAHGRLWSSLSLLQRQVFPSTDPEVATLRLTNRLHAVLWPAWAAHDLVVGTLQLYDQRAASPYR